MSETIIADGGKRKYRRKLPELKLVASDGALVEPTPVPAPQLAQPAPQAFSDRPIRKIAVCGSAVSSIHYAPYGEKDWEIWSCSPANKGQPRVDVWFELHNPTVKEREGLTEWLEWLKKQPIVYMQKPYPGYQGARPYPLKEIIEKYGPYWWTSQMSYMLALAIEQKPHTIGIFGVDMAATSEYNQQRLAFQHFIYYIIKETNIQLVVPPESDILEHAPLYGYCESSRNWRKLHARENELKTRIGLLQAEANQKMGEANHLLGAMDDMQYQLAHWANRFDFE